MSEAHVWDSQAIEWTASTQFEGLLIKPLETRATHPCARVTLVQLAVGGSIATHVHEQETETVFVLAGSGVLSAGGREEPVHAGMGATVPPGLAHGLRNSGKSPLQLYAVHTLPPA